MGDCMGDCMDDCMDDCIAHCLNAARKKAGSQPAFPTPAQRAP
jgi:hypothetical protein